LHPRRGARKEPPTRSQRLFALETGHDEHTVEIRQAEDADAGDGARRAVPGKAAATFPCRRRGAVLLASVMIGASQLGARSGGARATGATPPLASNGPDAALFAGIAQHGAALGSPRAAVTLVEYVDLQCPYCAEWTRQTLPVVVLNYVRSGKLRIVFRGLAFIGPESQLALETAVAAADDKLWNVVHALYRVQGAENRRLGQ
jgi:protein-disulfide isomerase